MPSRWNRVCNIEDWNDPEFSSLICRLLPYLAAAYSDFPNSHRHRKHWEYAHLIRAFEQLGVCHPDAWLLSVAGGHEEPAFWFTNLVRWVFVTDLYGTTGWSDIEAHGSALVDPDAFARFPYRRNRLVVQYMNALDLRYPDATFDGIFCLSSIEHFAGMDGARTALAGMRRVLKPGGIVAITTECVINSARDLDLPGLYLFTHKSLRKLATSVAGLEVIEEPDFSVSDATRATRYDLRKAIENAKQGHSHTPHLVLELEGREFTSAALFLRRTE
jgi:SAM-dependent methyltransferase